MSKLQELINELCPEGVEYKSLKEIGQFYSGLSGKKKKDFDTKGNKKYITYKNIFNNININVDELEYVNIGDGEKQNRVLNGDVLFTTSSESREESGMSSIVKDLNEETYLNSFSFGFRCTDTDLFNIDFLKHLFRSPKIRNQIIKTANGVTRYNVSKKQFENIEVPIPPIEIQNEIVKILDNFTKLTAELTAELTAREKQYKYYKEQIMSFQNVEYKKLMEIADMGTGSSNTRDETLDGEYPFFVRSQNVKKHRKYEFDETAIITSGDGVGVGKIFHYVEGKYALHQRAYRIKITNECVIPRFFYLYMETTFLPYIISKSHKSSVTSIRRPMLNEFPVPIASLEEQKRIITISDKFSDLTNDINEGIPAEIEARKKQYEYYRNKLLTFKEL